MKLLKTILVCVTTMVSCSIILSTAGCKSQPALERLVHDTLRIERKVIFRDTVFKTSSASVNTALPVPCPEFKKDFKPVSKTVKNATLHANMVGDSLVMDCVCDTLAITAKLRDTYEKEYRSSTRNTTVKEKKNSFDGFLVWSGVMLWALIISLLIHKLFTKK